MFSKTVIERKVSGLSLDLKTDRESLIRTVCGSEFQTDDAEHRKAHLEGSERVNSWTSNGVAILVFLGLSVLDLGPM